VEEPSETDPEGSQKRAKRPALAPEEQARADAEALRLGRYLPLGMLGGAGAGLVAGAITQRFGICLPVGIALGILLAGTLPVFMRRPRS
jgi:hypothetical protein